MPLYEYRCTKCNHKFEKIQKLSDPPVATCPECHGQVQQLLSAPAIQFKGAGWYVTDYAKKSASSPAGNGKSDGSASGSSETKSETKSESKSESKASGSTDKK